MKKILLFTSLFISFVNANALTRTSIANGDWSDPNTWSPTGVPQLSDDSIVVNTNVTFNVNIADGQAMFRITPTGSLIDLGQDTIGLGGDDAVISGYMSCYVLAVGMTNQFYNAGTISVATNFAQSGVVINAPSGNICVGQMLATSDNLTNNGSIATYNWTNSGVVNGTGRFCITNYFINGDTINGTLDICDASPNTVWDVNAGSIAGTVTYCTASPCSPCPSPAGIHSLYHDSWVVIGPNPFVQQLNIDLNEQVASSVKVQIEFYDATGKLIVRNDLNSGSNSIETSEMAKGIYLYRILVNGAMITSGKLIRE